MEIARRSRCPVLGAGFGAFFFQACLRGCSWFGLESSGFSGRRPRSHPRPAAFLGILGSGRPCCPFARWSRWVPTDTRCVGLLLFFSRQRRVSCLRPSSPRSLGADHGPPGESDLAPFDTEGLCFPSKSGPTVMRSLSGQGLGNTTHCAIIPGRRCVDSLLCFHLSLRPLSHGPRCHHHTDILSRRRKYTSTSAPLLWCCSATK